MLLNIGVEFHDGFQGPEDHRWSPLSGRVGRASWPEMGGSRNGDIPNWMVYNGNNIYMMEKPIKNVFLNGTSHKQMDDLGILVDLSIMLLKKTYNWRTSYCTHWSSATPDFSTMESTCQKDFRLCFWGP